MHPPIVEVMVRAVAASDRTSHYRVELRTDGGRVSVFEKETLLVYSVSGELLRDRSLIPTHIEI